MSKPPKRQVESWGELEDRLIRLLEFHSATIVEHVEACLQAVYAQDFEALSNAIDAYNECESPPQFGVTLPKPPGGPSGDVLAGEKKLLN